MCGECVWCGGVYWVWMNVRAYVCICVCAHVHFVCLECVCVCVCGEGGSGERWERGEGVRERNIIRACSHVHITHTALLYCCHGYSHQTGLR